MEEVVSYLANPFGVLCEENFERMQFLWDTLDVIQTIHTNDQLYACKSFLQLCYSRLDFGFFQTLEILRG